MLQTWLRNQQMTYTFQILQLPFQSSYSENVLVQAANSNTDNTMWTIT